MAELKTRVNVCLNNKPLEIGMRDTAKMLLKFAQMLRKQRMEQKKIK